MKVKLRDVLDFNSPINLRKLPPKLKIYAGIVSSYHESDSYKQKVNQAMEKTNIERMKKDEQLKEIILAQIFKAFSDESELKKRDKVCESVILKIPAVHKKALDRILEHREFMSYNISYIPENDDIRKAFPDMPYLLRVSGKILGGDRSNAKTKDGEGEREK